MPFQSKPAIPFDVTPTVPPIHFQLVWPPCGIFFALIRKWLLATRISILLRGGGAANCPYWKGLTLWSPLAIVRFLRRDSAFSNLLRGIHWQFRFYFCISYQIALCACKVWDQLTKTGKLIGAYCGRKSASGQAWISISGIQGRADGPTRSGCLFRVKSFLNLIFLLLFQNL